MDALGNLAPSSLADWVAGLATTAAVIIALGQIAFVAARQRQEPEKIVCPPLYVAADPITRPHAVTQDACTNLYPADHTRLVFGL